jgi:hypothetical protein
VTPEQHLECDPQTRSSGLLGSSLCLAQSVSRRDIFSGPSQSGPLNRAGVYTAIPLALALAYEQATRWHTRNLPLAQDTRLPGLTDGDKG